MKKQYPALISLGGGGRGRDYNVFYNHTSGALRKGKGSFPGGAVVENLPANAEDTGSSPGLGRSHMPQSN